MDGFMISVGVMLFGLYLEFVNTTISNIFLILIVIPICIEGLYYVYAYSAYPHIDYETTLLQSWRQTHRSLDEQVAEAYIKIWEIQSKTGKHPMLRQRVVYLLDTTITCPRGRILDDIEYYKFSCTSLRETLNIFTDFIKTNT